MRPHWCHLFAGVEQGFSQTFDAATRLVGQLHLLLRNMFCSIFGGEVTAVALHKELPSFFCFPAHACVGGSLLSTSSDRKRFDGLLISFAVSHGSTTIFFIDGVEAMYAYTISVNSGCDLQARTCSGIAFCMQVQVMLTV